MGLPTRRRCSGIRLQNEQRQRTQTTSEHQGTQNRRRDTQFLKRWLNSPPDEASIFAIATTQCNGGSARAQGGAPRVGDTSLVSRLLCKRRSTTPWLQSLVSCLVSAKTLRQGNPHLMKKIAPPFWTRRIAKKIRMRPTAYTAQKHRCKSDKRGLHGQKRIFMIAAAHGERRACPKCAATAAQSRHASKRRSHTTWNATRDDQVPRLPHGQPTIRTSCT